MVEAEFNQKWESVFPMKTMARNDRSNGIFVDMDNPYITLDNDYIESILVDFR